MDELIQTFLSPATFYNQLQERGFDFFTGVPDSLLKDICGYIHDHHP
jgi:phosphonopyruvate decarboxylase